MPSPSYSRRVLSTTLTRILYRLHVKLASCRLIQVATHFVSFKYGPVVVTPLQSLMEDQCYRVKEIGISSIGSRRICYVYKFYFDYFYTDVCINLTSFVESCWTGNLRILHSPLSTGEWTGTEASICVATMSFFVKRFIVDFPSLFKAWFSSLF